MIQQILSDLVMIYLEAAAYVVICLTVFAICCFILISETILMPATVPHYRMSKWKVVLSIIGGILSITLLYNFFNP